MAVGVAVVMLGLLALLNAVEGGGKTLVLLDSQAMKETHSIFFKSLQGMCVFYAQLSPNYVKLT